MAFNHYHLLICFVAVCLAASCGKAEQPSNSDPVVQNSDRDTIRIVSYNIRMSGLDKDDTNKWDVRKYRLAKSIVANAPDIMGVQEVSSTSQSQLVKLLAAEGADCYSSWYFSPYSQSGSGDKAQGILYRKDKFKISDKHFFWVSDTPEECTVNDTGSSGNFRRGGCCAVFSVIENPEIKLFVMVTHAALNSAPNGQNAYVYAQMEKKFNTEGLPCVFMGDMNAQPGSKAVKEYLTYWKDSYKYLQARDLVFGPVGTYNSYNKTEPASRIDYVFFKGDEITPLRYECNNSLFGMLFASDHFPIVVDMAVSKPIKWE